MAPRSSVRIWPPRLIESLAAMQGFFIMKYFVYILFSKLANRYYTGQTNNIENRIIEHNSGETKSIVNGIPWELVWSVEVTSRTEAMKLEKKI